MAQDSFPLGIFCGTEPTSHGAVIEGKGQVSGAFPSSSCPCSPSKLLGIETTQCLQELPPAAPTGRERAEPDFPHPRASGWMALPCAPAPPFLDPPTCCACVLRWVTDAHQLGSPATCFQAQEPSSAPSVSARAGRHQGGIPFPPCDWGGGGAGEEVHTGPAARVATLLPVQTGPRALTGRSAEPARTQGSGSWEPAAPLPPLS